MCPCILLKTIENYYFDRKKLTSHIKENHLPTQTHSLECTNKLTESFYNTCIYIYIYFGILFDNHNDS